MQPQQRKGPKIELGGKSKGPKAPPPMLCPVAREDSVEKMGLRISDNGTLQIDLLDGQQVAVRPVGVAPFPTSDPSSSETGPPELLGKVQWTDLKMGHVIGEGAQGKVRKVKHKETGVVYALKIITLGKQITKRTLQQELSRVLTIANHPNVVTSVEAFYIDGALKILMEYMDLGTLNDVLKQIGVIPVEPLSAITKQILDGLSSLHSSAIVHRDLKPSNLLINSQGYVKISDFGVSTFVNSVNPFAQTLIGSTAYMSPERVRAEKYDAKSDIWSVGLTVAQCAIGVYPFYTETPEEAASKNPTNPFERKVNMFDLAALIAEQRANVDFDVLVPKVLHFYPDKPKPIVTPELVDFVHQSMKQQASERPSCRELMKHPFISKHFGKVELTKWLKERGIKPQHHTTSSASASAAKPAAHLPPPALHGPPSTSLAGAFPVYSPTSVPSGEQSHRSSAGPISPPPAAPVAAGRSSSSETPTSEASDAHGFG